jgi:C4-type Zn-finger protein
MKSLLLVVIVFGVIFSVLIWSLLTLSERIDNLEGLKIDSYQESTRMRFDKVHAMNMKLIRQQEEHDKKIEVLRLRLDKLIEKEKRLTFDSTDPGYHRELLKALTELKDIKDREKKLNEEIEEILQTGDL